MVSILAATESTESIHHKQFACKPVLTWQFDCIYGLVLGHISVEVMQVQMFS